MSATAGVNFIHFWVTWKSGKMAGTGERRLYLMGWADPANTTVLKWQCAYDTRSSSLTIDTSLIPPACLNAFSGGETF